MTVAFFLMYFTHGIGIWSFFSSFYGVAMLYDTLRLWLEIPDSVGLSAGFFDGSWNRLIS